jgi:hypothetical protein
MINVPTGTTSYSIDVKVLNDSGVPVTGLVAATFPATSYSKGSNAAATSITLSDLAAITTAYTSGGLKERSAGVYRLDLPNGALSSTAAVTVLGYTTGKHLFAPPIQVGGVPLANIAHTITSLSVTGGMSIAGATDSTALTIAGNGTGSGIVINSGTGLDAHGVQISALSSNGNAVLGSSASETVFLESSGSVALECNGNGDQQPGIFAGGGIACDGNFTINGVSNVAQTGNSYPLVSGGTGAYARTVTVTASAVAVSGARVTMTNGVNRYNATTNASGVASFGLDAATYTLTVSSAGYSHTPASVTVSAAGNTDTTLTAITITPASDPAQTTGYVTCYDKTGTAAAGVSITLMLCRTSAAAAGLSHTLDERTVVSNANGLVEFTGLLRQATYKAKRGGSEKWTAPFITADATTSPLPEILGQDT